MKSKYKKDIPKAPFYRLTKTPRVIQMEAVECGAAALCSILAYYGKYLTLEELRQACSVNRDGASVLGILNAAEKYGLLSEAHLVDLEDLYEMPLPLIAYWEFKHFVIIEGFSRNKVFINDPAEGRHSISYEDLSNSFTGVVLIFEQSLEFKKSGYPENLYTIVLNLTKKNRAAFAFAFITAYVWCLRNWQFQLSLRFLLIMF